MSCTLKNVQTASVEGDQVFNFPNINLAPGKILYIVSGSDALSSANSIAWTKKQIWLNTGYAAQLKNAKGEVVSELP